MWYEFYFHGFYGIGDEPSRLGANGWRTFNLVGDTAYADGRIRYAVALQLLASEEIWERLLPLNSYSCPRPIHISRRCLLQASSYAALSSAIPKWALAKTAYPQQLVAQPRDVVPGQDVGAKTPLWTFNNTSPGPLIRVKRGEQIELGIVNDTQWPHAMHTHGHHFDTKNKLNNNATPALLRDTALVDPGETLTVRFIADNSGKWLIHCHTVRTSGGRHGDLV